MMMDADMAVAIRRAWLMGRCPCCGSELDEWLGTQPKAVAEGVAFCGRCIRNEHHLTPEGFLELLLEALLP